LQYLAEFIYVNHGKMRPDNVGQVNFGRGAYGRIGLSLMDAFHLVNLVSCMEGIWIGTEASEIQKAAAHTKIQVEIARVEKLMQEYVTTHPILPTPEQVEAITKGTLINGHLPKTGF